MIFPWRSNKVDADPVVRSYISRHIHSPQTFASRIDEDDEMFLFDLQVHNGDRRRVAIGYYRIGSRILGGIRQIADWHFGGLQNVGSFLDFACGYGRSTRFLIREMPPSRIWACDIYANAIKFQTRYHGVNGIVSVPDPASFPRNRQFDFIFASSFFSHMPETTFGRWIETLLDLLTPRGILVFSTHDTSLMPPSIPVPPSGIYFEASSESRTLDKNQYGNTYVNEEFVTTTVDRVSQGKTHLHRVKRGLVGFQDLYILGNDLSSDFSNLDFVHDPSGCLDKCQLSPAGEAVLTGWAADFNPGGSIREIQVLLNDTVMEAVTPSHDRPDIAQHFKCPAVLRSGWTCQLGRYKAGTGDIIEVKVISNKNKSLTILYDYLTSTLSQKAAAG
jgi:SAM-dependent methyltransferase